jgi:Zn-dependent M28 family amino/carboxypeptidase
MAALAPQPIAGADEALLKSLRRDVDILARQIGPRNPQHYAALVQAAEFCQRSFRGAGYAPRLQRYHVRDREFANIIAEIEGSARRAEIMVVGAHYDTHKDSPGANDNASAVAALLHLARALAGSAPVRTVRFVAFTNEERPFTRTRRMGSRVYARECRERGEQIVGMIGLEMLGCYLPQKGAQWLSLGGLLLPREGDFLAVVGNRASRMLLDQITGILRETDALPIVPVVLPSHVPGAWSSDHWSFWREGFPAVMTTDTGPLRYRYYHRTDDTPDKVDFGWLAQVVAALKRVLRSLANP